eukprot:353357-Chlamydomonas_euryale.AAC.1
MVVDCELRAAGWVAGNEGRLAGGWAGGRRERHGALGGGGRVDHGRRRGHSNAVGTMHTARMRTSRTDTARAAGTLLSHNANRHTSTGMPTGCLPTRPEAGRQVIEPSVRVPKLRRGGCSWPVNCRPDVAVRGGAPA